MRNIRLLTVILCVFGGFLSLFAQEITLNLQQVELEKVLSTISNQSGYSFYHSRPTVNPNEIVSIKVENSTLEETLDKLFEATEIDYEIKSNKVYLVAKKEVENNGVYTGTIVDSQKLPIIGVAVMLKGTDKGSLTDVDGKFSLKLSDLSSTDVLVFNCLGYKTIELPIGERTVFNLVMEEDAIMMEGTVVTALGIKRSEKALSYNVQEVDQDEILKVKDANFVNSLNGKIAGVSISKSASGVGGATRVVMRGAKSIEGDNNALYVIDGIPLFNTNMGNTDSGIMGEGKAGTEGIADFNPEDIESISILSGPSAAALYGSSAANGVVLITTKKGKEGKLSVAFSSSTEFTKAYMTPEFQNSYGNKKDVYESWGEKSATPFSYDPKNDFFNTGVNLINSVALTSGTKRNQTFASISSTNSTGIVPNNTYDRLNFTIRNTATFFQDKLELDLGASYVNQKDQNMVSQGQYWNPVMAAYLFPRGESFEAIKTFETFNDSRKIPEQNWNISDPVYASQNPYWTAHRNVSTNEKSRYMFNAGLKYNILEWLNVTARYRMDDSHVLFERKIYATSDQKFAEGEKGHYEYINFKDRQEYADAMVNINKRFDKFTLAANAGWNYSNYWALSRGYKGTLLGVTNDFNASNIDPNNGRVSETGGGSSVRNHAIFANLELGWDSMLYLTLTGRNDWNSRLVNTKESSFFYPSVGLSAIVTEMVELPKFISYLKVRGSFTQVGAPVSRSGLTPGTITTPVVGGVIEETYIYPFTDFKAERTNSYEFGMSLRLWERLRAELTYYKSNTYNQTFLGELPEFTNYKQIYLQAGNVENRGWEASLGYFDTMENGLSISSNVTFSRNVNEIKEMVDSYKVDFLDDPIQVSEVKKDNGRVILKKGGSIHDIYANSFFKKDHQGFVEVAADGTYGLETTDPVFLGKVAPDFNLGWNNSIAYKGFALSFLINARFGGVVTSSTEAILDRFGVSKNSGIARDLGGALLPGQGRVDAKTYYKMIGTGGYETSGYYVYDATNIRVQEIALSYTMPNKWFKDVVKDLTLTVISNNPFMLYCKAPFDPELTPSTATYGQGNDYFMQPSVRSLGFSVKFKF